MLISPHKARNFFSPSFFSLQRISVAFESPCCVRFRTESRMDVRLYMDPWLSMMYPPAPKISEVKVHVIHI